MLIDLMQGRQKFEHEVKQHQPFRGQSKGISGNAAIFGGLTDTASRGDVQSFTLFEVEREGSVQEASASLSPLSPTLKVRDGSRHI